MFKKFIQRIIESENREDAIQNVFYRSVVRLEQEAVNT